MTRHTGTSDGDGAGGSSTTDATAKGGRLTISASVATTENGALATLAPFMYTVVVQVPGVVSKTRRENQYHACR